jgi:hypothetical protein
MDRMKWAMGMVLLAACGSVSNDDKIDAKPADAPIDAAPDSTTRRCDPNKPFDAPVALDDVNTTSNEGGASLSPNELTMYFYSNRTGVGSVGMHDIYVTTRASLTSAFETPGVLANVNTANQEEWPSVTADGLFLYIDTYSGPTNWDIEVAQRASTTLDFPAPTKVASLNATDPSEDDNQFVLPDNSAMYFVSTRNGSIRDIYRAPRNVGGTFGTAIVVNATPADQEVGVVVTPDELTMYYSSDATGTLGLYDTWMRKRTTTSDGWGMPVHLTDLSSTTIELVNWISADGCDLYFQRDTANRGYDLYLARKPM